MRFSLQEAASQSGLSKRMVRALEVRYCTVQSGRDRRGRLCYTKQDIARLKIFAEAIALGMDVKSVAHCSNEELRQQISEFSKPENSSLALAIKAVERMIGDYDSSGLEKLLYDYRLELPRERLIYDLILPLIGSKNLNSTEKSFWDYELQSFLSQIIKSSFAKEYFPDLILISDSVATKNLTLAVGALLASYSINVTFAGSTKSYVRINEVCRKTDCHAAVLVGDFCEERFKELSHHNTTYISVINISAQELIDTNFSVERNVLKGKISEAIENIKRELKI